MSQQHSFIEENMHSEMKTVYIYFAFFFYFAITVACFDAAAIMIIISVQALTHTLGCGTVGTEQTTEFFTCSVQFLSRPQ